MNDQPSTINLFINGAPALLPSGATIAALLAARNITPRNVAVEVNGAIAPKSTHADTALTEGDCVEIIGFIGGG